MLSSFSTLCNNLFVLIQSYLTPRRKKLNPFFRVPDDMFGEILSYLKIEDICCMDIAVTNTAARASWLHGLHAIIHQTISEYNHCRRSLTWLSERAVRLVRLIVKDCQWNTSSSVSSAFIGLNKSLLRYVSFRNCDFGDTKVLSIFNDCPNILEICLYDCRGVTDASFRMNPEENLQLEPIAIDRPSLNQINSNQVDSLHRSNLKVINLSGCAEVTDIGILDVAHSCSQLEIIDLSYVSNITNASVFAIAENCPRLTSIDLSYCQRITDTGVSALATGCLLLTEINLSSCPEITGASLLTLAENCSQLNNINMSSCEGITDTSLQAAAQNCRNLKTLNISGCFEIGDPGLESIARICPLLTEIDISWCGRITETGVLALVEQCRNLKKMNVYLCLNITNEFIDGLRTTHSHLSIKTKVPCKNL